MRFGVLFEVAVLHDYWLNVNAVVYEALSPERQRVVGRQHDPGSYIEVVPTAATRAVLAGHGMLFKKLSTGFLIGAELEGATMMHRRALGSSDVLTFALRVVDPLFFNYTAGVLPRFYRFSNTTGNENDGQLFLSHPVPAHQAARAYQAGEIRAVVSGGTASTLR